MPVVRNFAAARASLPVGFEAAVTHFVSSGFPVDYTPNRTPKSPTGSMGATGLFTNHDYLTDTLACYLFVVELEGEDGPNAMILEASLINISRWLARIPVEKIDTQHGQSMPALFSVGLLFDDQEILDAAYRWASALTNNPMLRTRVGMTTRAWFRFHAQMARAAATVRRIKTLGLDEIPNSIDTARIFEAAVKSINQLELWAIDRGELGKTGEEARGFTTTPDAPWSLRSRTKKTWPYYSGSADFIAFHDQPFMYSAVLGHSIAWFLAEDTPLGLATRVRFRELATWALWAFWDPATNSALEALHRGGAFRPALDRATGTPAILFPFSEWAPLDRQLEGELHHSLAGSILGATVKRSPRARLLRRMLGTTERPEDAWLQKGEIDTPSVIAWAFLDESLDLPLGFQGQSFFENENARARAAVVELEEDGGIDE